MEKVLNWEIKKHKQHGLKTNLLIKSAALGARPAK
jgi:hypothetical protein